MADTPSLQFVDLAIAYAWEIISLLCLPRRLCDCDDLRA